MNRAGTGGRQANAEFPSGLRVSAGHERRRLFVAYLDEPDLVLTSSQGLHDSVDTITRQSEDEFHSPVDKRFNENVGTIHVELLLLRQKISNKIFHAPLN